MTDETSKKKYSRWNIVPTMLLSYSLLEFLIVSSDCIPKIEIAQDSEKARKVYDARHLLFYEFNQPDANLGIIPKPDVKMMYSPGEGYALISSDAFGFRNNLVYKEDAEFAAVGDSFTMGYGLDIEESWSHILGTIIGGEVANYGVVGYGIWQYNKILEEYSAFFQDKVILYGIYSNDFSKDSVDDSLANDFYERKSWDNYKTAFPSEEELIKAVYARKPFYHKTLTFKIFSLLNPDIKKVQVPEGTTLYKHTSGPEVGDASEEGLKKLCKSLEEAINLVRDYNSEMIVLYFPSKNRIYHDRYVEAFEDDTIIRSEGLVLQTITQLFENNGIPLLDFTRIFHEEERKNHRPVYMANEFHLNAYGNRVVAENLASFLATHKSSSDNGINTTTPTSTK